MGAHHPLRRAHLIRGAAEHDHLADQVPDVVQRGRAGLGLGEEGGAQGEGDEEKEGAYAADHEAVQGMLVLKNTIYVHVGSRGFRWIGNQMRIE